MGLVHLPFTANSTIAECTKPIAMGWTLCNDTYRSINEPLLKTTKTVVQLLIIPSINRFLQQNYQGVIHKQPDCNFGCFWLILVKLLHCLHHTVCFSDWLYAYPVASTVRFLCICWDCHWKPKLNPEESRLIPCKLGSLFQILQCVSMEKW